MAAAVSGAVAVLRGAPAVVERGAVARGDPARGVPARGVLARPLPVRAGVVVGLGAASSVDGVCSSSRGSAAGASAVAAAARAAAAFDAAVVRGAAAFVVRAAAGLFAAGVLAAGFFAAGFFAAGAAPAARGARLGCAAGAVSAGSAAAPRGVGPPAAARFSAAEAALDVRVRGGVAGVARPVPPALARDFCVGFCTGLVAEVRGLGERGGTGFSSGSWSIVQTYQPPLSSWSEVRGCARVKCATP